jgi:methionyl-tRNA synthetase
LIQEKEAGMAKRFYITTPIYYVNAEPHIGHAYTTIVADVMNRFHKLMGYETFFLTGTDEHGDKIAQAAQQAGLDPQSYVDRMSQLFRDTWPKLNISNDYFIRTTDSQHVRVVQAILQKVYDAGEIYFDSYKGLYCVGCERFYTERELIDGKCPDHDREPIEREEANYFFRMSKYQQWLIQHIQQHPDFIRPERYRNEVLAFLAEPLEDLCISRPKQRLDWGISLPFDGRYVTYVWFDALINYVTALDYPEGPLFQTMWPVAQHLIAKDILKPHGIYWPTIIRAAGLEPYRHLNVHGYWKTEEGKMSKSRGTVVRPLDLVPVYGLDAFRYFLLREMVFGLDANFNEKALVSRLNADLANDLGNLFSRTLAMTAKYFDGKVPPFAAGGNRLDEELRDQLELTRAQYLEEIPRWSFHKALMSVWELIGKANKYIDEVGPWNLAKEPSQRERLATVLRNLLEINKMVAVLIAPVMPETAEKMLERLGVSRKALDLRLEVDTLWGTLAEGVQVSKGEALFPRIETDHEITGPVSASGSKKHKKAAGAEKSPTVATPSPAEQLISLEAFKKIDLRTGIIKHAEKIPKSEKLLRLVVDIGEERQVVAGLGQTHAPRDLVGKQVIVMTNLEPTRLMGVESQGMVLAVRDADTLSLLTTECPVTPGCRVT